VLRTLFASVAFLSALLLFQVQPMLGKRLLPWYGGSPATWTACMLFFQLLLLGGYAWADALVRRAPQRLQLILQLALLAAAIALLPIGPSDADRPVALDAPLLQILSVLARTAGVPYLALACTAPLLQHWYERASGQSPYALYAFSNAGSLLGLLLYPFALEPLLPMAQQARLWSTLFVLFAAGLAACGLRAGRAARPRAAAPDTAPPPSAGVQARWFALALVPSVLLLAVTNHITVDVAAVPFLWVAPLTLYLLSFVLAFAGERFCPRGLLLPLWVACTGALGIGLFAHGTASLAQQLLVPLISLFVCALLCHGELARAQPPPAQLSRFYLLLSAGGAAGGVFVGVCAPLLFTGFFELQIAVIAAYAVLLWALPREPRTPALSRWLWLGVGLGVPFIAASIWVQGQDRTRSGRVIEQRRSFYGVLGVIAIDKEGVTLLTHGRIRHGMQFQDPARALEPTLYFGPDSGAGRVLRLHAIDRPRRIGVVGLGAGTLAAYGRAGDHMRFYEISPDVVAAARTHFSFLRNSAADVEISVGDGRLALEREPAQGFDVLVLDAFSSDSVPAHLLTTEAFAIYARQLRKDGVLLANVSNRHLDVERAVAGSAAHAGFVLRIVETESDAARGYARARWALMARTRAQLDRLLAGATPSSLRGAPVTWRDDFSNLAQLLR
jgi:SAM-dependent methyltransferase